MRRAARVDSNQAEVIDALKRVGVAVEIIGLPLDLLIHSRKGTALMEIKAEDGRLTKQQVEFMARWPGPIHVVRTPAEAVEAAIGPIS